MVKRKSMYDREYLNITMSCYHGGDVEGPSVRRLMYSIRGVKYNPKNEERTGAYGRFTKKILRLVGMTFEVFLIAFYFNI